MKKGVVDVELVYRPATLGSEMEHSAYCCRFDDRTVRLAVVDAGALREHADHPSRLVAIEAPVFLEFVNEDPFAADYVCSRWTRDKLPGVVGD